MRFEFLSSRLKTAAVFPDSRMSAMWPLMFCAVGIFILSSIPGNHYPTVDVRYADKWMHFLMYLPLGLSAARYFWWSAKSAWVWPMLFGAIYGATDELHQLFVPKRSCSFSDFVTDVAAVTTACVIWRIGHRLVRKNDGREMPSNRLDAVDWAA